ncbi:MAG: M23 family metallopeptidase [bacterium]
MLSPVRGRITQVVDNLPDSPIGVADKANNWGNVVVIEDMRGFFVELSHFAAKSIRVKEGDWVERGAVLGLCGNSGYSPQPHIHVQSQLTTAIGAASVPFSFVSYADNGEFHSNNLPKEQHAIEPLYQDKRLDNITNFMIDDELHYQVFHNGRVTGKLALKVKMAPDGIFYFESRCGQLYFGKYEGTFYFYRVTGSDPWLRLLFLALPRMPLAYREKLTWKDYVPADLALTGLRAAVVGFLGSIYPKLATAEVTQIFVRENCVESVIDVGLLSARKAAAVEFDRQKGFRSVTVGEIQMMRVDKDEA